MANYKIKTKDLIKSLKNYSRTIKLKKKLIYPDVINTEKIC